jgi:hypothetical protein
MDFAGAVTKGRRLLARSEHDQWELAWLTYHVLVEKQLGTIAEWATALGVSETQVNNLRNVWDLYGDPHHDETRTKLTFNECMTLAGVSPARRKRLREVAEATGTSVSTVHRTGRDRHPDRVRKARELVGDDEVARDLVRDPKARRILQRALRHLAAEEDVSRGPKAVGGDSQDQMVEELATHLAAVNALLGRMATVKLERDTRRSVVDLVGRFEHSLEWMGAYAKSSNPSLAESLQGMLAAGLQERTPPPGSRPDDTPERVTGNGKAARAPAEVADAPVSDPTSPPDSAGRERERRAHGEREGPKRRGNGTGDRGSGRLTRT